VGHWLLVRLNNSHKTSDKISLKNIHCLCNWKTNLTLYNMFTYSHVMSASYSDKSLNIHCFDIILMTKNISFNVAVKFILVSGVPLNSQSFSRWELVTECAYLYVCMVVVFVNFEKNFVQIFVWLFTCLVSVLFCLLCWFLPWFLFYFICACTYTHTHAHTNTNSSTGLWHPSSCARKQCPECNTITQWHTHTHTAHTHSTRTHAHMLICLFVWQN